MHSGSDKQQAPYEQAQQLIRENNLEGLKALATE